MNVPLTSGVTQIGFTKIEEASKFTIQDTKSGQFKDLKWSIENNSFKYTFDE